MTRFILAFVSFAVAASAQLSTEQKIQDFRHLAGLYNKQYAPASWKKVQFGFDILDTAPWIEKVRATRNDLEFYDLMTEYVGALRDSHVYYAMTTDFLALLGFVVDLYDNKALVDSIDRTRLPVARYPFGIGDELVSVDGRDVESWLNELAIYGMGGNTRATRRTAAQLITRRPQNFIPRAPELGDAADVVIRRISGDLESYTIPWVKTGTPARAGRVPTPMAAASSQAEPSDRRSQAIEDAMVELPEYLRTWVETQYSAVEEERGVLGYGSRTPLFNLPANFVQRLGRVPADFFFSGTYEASGMRIGYIRIPSYGTLAAAVQQQFDTEIAFLQANTDGLVVDEMRNPGGFLCFGENIAARLIPQTFRATGFEYRATWSRVNGFYNSLTAARTQNAEQWVIDYYQVLFDELYAAYRSNRGLTGALPVCTPSLNRAPAADNAGRIIAYTKPILMITDEFSTSTADSVPAMFQDASRGILFGMRTNGAGGTNTSFAGGAYGEGSVGMTLGLMARKGPVVTPDHPTSHYIENTGVRPDIEADFMTRENLLTRGAPFVSAFTAAIVEHIRKSR